MTTDTSPAPFTWGEHFALVAVLNAARRSGEVSDAHLEMATAAIHKIGDRVERAGIRPPTAAETIPAECEHEVLDLLFGEDPP